MADDRGGAGRREFLICRLNDNVPGIKPSRSMSKPNFDYSLSFFEIWLSSMCESVFDRENTCQKHDIDLHILLHTAWWRV